MTSSEVDERSHKKLFFKNNIYEDHVEEQTSTMIPLAIEPKRRCKYLEFYEYLIEEGNKEDITLEY